MSELGNYYIRRYERGKDSRVNWDALWQDAANYTTPNNNDIYNSRTSGERKFTRLYDSTGVQANKLLASALHGMLTSPTSKWFGLGIDHTDEPSEDEKYEQNLWFDDSVERMFSVLNSSNFQSQIHEVYLGLGSIGTPVLFMGEDVDKVIYFRADSIYNYTIGESKFGNVDTVMYTRKMTYKNLVEEYGIDNIDEATKEMGMSNQNREITVLIVVEPNKDYEADQPPTPTNKPIRTVHIIRKTAHVVREGGFNEQPFAVPRWNKFPNELYGRAPSMESLPDNKMVNAMMKVNIRGAQKVVDPALVVPDHGFALPLDTRPGGTIYKRQGIQDKIDVLNTGARPDIGEDMMESARLRIRQAFFIDQLQLVQQNNMTATEVMQRTEENLRLMGPILGRLNDELLRPIVERLFGIMMRRGMFLPAPPSLKGKDIKIKYISQIAKAQRASELDTLNRVIQTILPVLQAQPQMMDNFSGDDILRSVASELGLPAEYLLSPEEVGKARDERAEQEQQAQAAAMRNQEADTINKLSGAQGAEPV